MHFSVTPCLKSFFLVLWPSLATNCALIKPIEDGQGYKFPPPPPPPRHPPKISLSLLRYTSFKNKHGLYSISPAQFQEVVGYYQAATWHRLSGPQFLKRRRWDVRKAEGGGGGEGWVGARMGERGWGRRRGGRREGGRRSAVLSSYQNTRQWWCDFPAHSRSPSLFRQLRVGPRICRRSSRVRCVRRRRGSRSCRRTGNIDGQPWIWTPCASGPRFAGRICSDRTICSCTDTWRASWSLAGACSDLKNAGYWVECLWVVPRQIRENITRPSGITRHIHLETHSN